MIPIPYAGWIVAGCAALMLGATGVQSYRLNAEQLAHETTKREYAYKVVEAEIRARDAEKAERAEEQRRITELEGVANEARKREAAARADARRAADAGQRLREQYATSLAAVCTGASSDTTATVRGVTSDKAIDLLADVQRRLDEAADGIAEFAEDSHRRSETCAESYGKVRNKK